MCLWYLLANLELNPPLKYVVKRTYNKSGTRWPRQRPSLPWQYTRDVQVCYEDRSNERDTPGSLDFLRHRLVHTFKKKERSCTYFVSRYLKFPVLEVSFLTPLTNKLRLRCNQFNLSDDQVPRVTIHLTRLFPFFYIHSLPKPQS